MKGDKRIWFLLGFTTIAVVAALYWYGRLQREPDASEAVFYVPPKRTPLINPFEEQLLSEFQTYVDSIRIRDNIPALAVAIVRGGQTIFLSAEGDKVNNAANAVDIDTKFRLASVSKGFSAILTARLIRDGKLSWDDLVVDFIPDFHPEPKSFSDSLTVGNLISQTSGFPYQAYSNLVEDGWTLPEMIHAIGNLRLANKPGTIYSYQNVAYSLIEPILEVQSGSTFPDLLDRHIFKPLGMQNASARYEDMRDAENAATPHRKTRYSYVPIRLSPSYYNTAAAGGIHASISDMAMYLDMLLGNRPNVADSLILNEVFEPRIITPLLNRYYRKWLKARRAYYGLGWRIVPLETDTIVYHGGYANGFKSHISLDRDDEIAICVLSNSSDNIVNEAGPYFFHLYYQYRENIQNWETIENAARYDSLPLK